MKKISVLILLFLFCSSYAQEFGATKINVEKKSSDYNEGDHEIWIDFSNSYIMTFKQNPVGIKKAFTILKRILSENDLNFETPSVDDVYLSSLVSSIYDYEILDLTIRQGSSEVKKIWELNGKLIAISLIEKSYFITIKK